MIYRSPEVGPRAFLKGSLSLALGVGFATAQQSPLAVEPTGYQNTFRLSWESAVGKTYFLQQSTVLEDWNYFPLILPGNGDQDWMGVSSTADKGFFRYIRSEIPTHDVISADHDGDGVPSFAELTVTNTDPLKFSTAGSGISDRMLFPKPTTGLYTDGANGIQYVILPLSPGTTEPARIVATHYFEAPDYSIEFKKAEKSLEKFGYSPWVITQENSSKRYLSYHQSPGAADTGYKRLASSVWQMGFTDTLNNQRVVAWTSDDLRISGINPENGVESVLSNNDISAVDLSWDYIAPWGWTQATWRGKWWSRNGTYYFDVPPYALYWDGVARPFFEERLKDENTLENVGLVLAANRPPYDSAWREGNPWARWDHWTNGLGVSYSRTKFRIKNKNGIPNGEPAHVIAYFDPEGGEREEVMSVEWNGQGKYSPEYEIDPASLRPGVQGTFHINAGSIFFELDLAQADARKGGETVVIGMKDSSANPLTSFARTFSTPEPETAGGIPGAITFPGMDDKWYEGCTITLNKTAGNGAAVFKVLNPYTGAESTVPYNQDLAADYFHSRGQFTGFEWKIYGAVPGRFTCSLTYTKGNTVLALTRTALIRGVASILSDLDNNGVIDQMDKSFKLAARIPDTASGALEEATEYMFVNDDLSNGSWDKDDIDPNRPQTATLDDDVEVIAIQAGVTEGLLWFEHPAIDRLSFYSRPECTAIDLVSIKQGAEFIISPQHPSPGILYIRSDTGGNLPANLEIGGSLTLHFKALATDSPVEIASLQLTLVKEFGASTYFLAANDYILERNTEIFVRDKTFPVNSSNPTARLRVSSLRAAATTMVPFEAYEPNYEHWVQSGSPGDGFTTTNRIAVGLDEVMNASGSSSLLINGNLCDFSSGISAVEAAALSVVGLPLMTDKCHGNIKELNRPISPVSNTHFDATTDAPRTHMKGHRFAGPDPIPGTTPPIPGGKTIAQYDDGRFVFSADYAPTAILANTTTGFVTNLSQLGGLATNYEDPAKDTTANQLIGIFRSDFALGDVIFTATDVIEPSGILGYVAQIYQAAKSSGVADLTGATHVPGTLKPIELLLLDGGISTSLAYKNGSGKLQKSISQSKNTGFPYYINTFLQFASSKPRP